MHSREGLSLRAIAKESRLFGDCFVAALLAMAVPIMHNQIEELVFLLWKPEGFFYLFHGILKVFYLNCVPKGGIGGDNRYLCINSD